MNKEIILQVRSVYGNKNIYPVCHVANALIKFKDPKITFNFIVSVRHNETYLFFFCHLFFSFHTPINHNEPNSTSIMHSSCKFFKADQSSTRPGCFFIFFFFSLCSDYKHKRDFFQTQAKKTQAIFRLRFKVQLTYALIFFSRIFSIVPLWSMIL